VDTLKEWATVVKALENGDQTILLRKGGILEAASGFKIQSKRFFLFPTFEHQKDTNLKPEFQNYLDDIKENQPENNFNKISSYAKIVDARDIQSEEKIKLLSPFHIWSESYIAERLSWLPQKPMKVIFLQVFKIPEFEISIRDEYQGCKSWININSESQVGNSVLNKSKIEQKLMEFRRIVN